MAHAASSTTRPSYRKNVDCDMCGEPDKVRPCMSKTRIAVVIATLGRPDEVGQLLLHLKNQTHAPSDIIVSVTGHQDLPSDMPDGVRVVQGSRGLPAQRNRGMIEVLGACDLIAFFDDDYVPSRYALAGAAALFERFPDIVGATGNLVADGITSAGIDYPKAVTLVEQYDRNPQPAPLILKEGRGLYGCNMIFRAAQIQGTRFDENLPLYGWQEDADFAARMMTRGSIVKSQAFAGVHRGVKGGRTSDVRLGYSQIANPIYLSRKGTMRWGYAARVITRNFAANHFKALWPEPWVDRMGRVRGNWLALGHLLTGRLDPMKVLKI